MKGFLRVSAVPRDPGSIPRVSLVYLNPGTGLLPLTLLGFLDLGLSLSSWVQKSRYVVPPRPFLPYGSPCTGLLG